MKLRTSRLVMVGAALVASCWGLVAATGSVSASSTTSVTFAYDWITPDMELIPVVVAEKEGYFTAHGLDLKVIFPPSTSTTAKFLALGRAQLGFITTTDMADAVANKVPLLSIANYSMSNNWGLFTKPGVTIPLSKLKGKTIFSYGDTWTDAMLPFVVKKAGLTMSQVKIVTGDNDVAYLLAGRTNFSTSTTNYEIPYIKAATKKHVGPGETLTGSAIGVPNIPIWNYATTPSYARNHPTVVKEFLAAVLEGTKWAIQHPTQAAAMFDAAYPSNGEPNSTNLQGWNLTVPLLTNSKGQFFTETDAQWTTLDQALKATNQITKIPAPSTYYTNKYQP